MTLADLFTPFSCENANGSDRFQATVAGSRIRQTGRIAVAPAIACVFAIGCTSFLQADVLYTVNGSSLSVVDTTTRTAKKLGSLGSYRVGGLTIAADGQLYGVSTIANQLVSIDIDTKANKVVTTPIAELDKHLTLSTDLACDPLDPSKALYGVADFDPNTELFSIDLDTLSAQTTKIANLNTGGIVGLAFDPSGQLWGIDGRFDTQEQLVKIDKETGQVIVVEPKGLKDFSNIGGLAIGPTGSFWALNSSGSNVDLISIDPNSGTGENRGSIANLRGDLGVFGLVAAIPEPATLITMLLGVLGFQVFVCRRFKNRR